MSNRNDYQRDYMRRYRAKQPTSEKGKMRKALEAIRDEMADSVTDKGKRLHTLAVEALGAVK